VQEGNLQSKARDARYQLLTNYCKQNEIQCLLTAHNKNDVAETVLMRIERGSGIDGISAIPRTNISNDVEIIRPLLDFTRVEILDILQKAKWQWVEDPSNANIVFARSRIRKFLSEQEDASLWVKRLALLASNAARCRDFLEQETLKHLHITCVISEYGYLTLSRAQFILLHEEMQLRILACILKVIGGDSYVCKLVKLKELVHNIVVSRQSSTLMKCEIVQSSDDNILFIKEHAYIEALVLDHQMKSLVWDGRFQIEFEGSKNLSDEWCISPINEEIWKTIKAEYRHNFSYKVVLTMPILIINKKLVIPLFSGAKQIVGQTKIHMKAILEEKIASVLCRR
jgi:tRNA(Ile)-lysidine synthase